MEVNATLNTKVTFEPKFYFVLIGCFFIVGIAIVANALIKK